MNNRLIFWQEKKRSCEFFLQELEHKYKKRVNEKREEMKTIEERITAVQTQMGKVMLEGL